MSPADVWTPTHWFAGVSGARESTHEVGAGPWGRL
jgi:hypothetical protein